MWINGWVRLRNKQKSKITDMEYYLDNVLNPEDLSGLTKKYRINLIESSDYFRRAEIHILALNEIGSISVYSSTSTGIVIRLLATLL